MAEHLPAGPAELGAPMDYAEHMKTYDGFIALTKITILACINVVQALAIFGFGTGGFWLGVLLLVLMALGIVIGLVAKGSAKPLAVVTVIGFLLMALSLG